MTGHILVVDDNPQNLKLVRVLLSGEGYDVVTATDAEEALRAIEASEPSLILMDVQLPGMDGLALTRKLKSDPKRKHIIVIVLTAYAMKGDEQRVVAAGADGYVAKPIDGDALTALVAQKLKASGLKIARANRERFHFEVQRFVVGRQHARGLALVAVRGAKGFANRGALCIARGTRRDVLERAALIFSTLIARDLRRHKARLARPSSRP